MRCSPDFGSHVMVITHLVGFVDSGGTLGRWCHPLQASLPLPFSRRWDEPEFWGNVDLGGRAVEGFGSRRATLSDVRIYQPPRAGALESTGPSSPGNRKSGGGGRDLLQVTQSQKERGSDQDTGLKDGHSWSLAFQPIRQSPGLVPLNICSAPFWVLGV